MELFEKCKRFTIAREIQAAGVYPFFHRVDSAQDPEVIIEGRRMIMVGSNNYLGLASDWRVKRDACAATRKYGAGCVGSRFLNGSLPIHEELEERLARFVGKDAAIVFATGMQANLGAISALAGKDDIVICDKYDHASVIDGCRLSYARLVRYRHNDMGDLERVLRAAGDAGKLIVVDGVFSMEGDVANLPNIIRLARRYQARVMVDDAHGLGVMGRRGRGTVAHFGLTDKADLIMGTFSKSLASIGGFVAGSEEIIHYIKHHARSFIFSAALSPGCVGAVLAALDILDKEPHRLERLWVNARKMRSGFRKMGYDIGTSETPIIPIVVGEDLTAFRMWRILFDRGIFTTPAVTPATPPGRALIRTSYMATHTDEILDYVLETFEEVGREMGLIGPNARARQPRGAAESVAALREEGIVALMRSVAGNGNGANGTSSHPRWGQLVVSRRIRQGYERTMKTMRETGSRWMGFRESGVNGTAWWRFGIDQERWRSWMKRLFSRPGS